MNNGGLYAKIPGLIKQYYDGKLPDSTRELFALMFVGMIAGLAAFSRLLYGSSDLTWRYTVGSMMLASVTAIAVYSVLADSRLVSGYMACAIGVSVGLFTEDALRRLRAITTGKNNGSHR